jgi:AcrR family transcriptional regulator
MGLRDRKKVATRRAIRVAALRLVSERGFAHVTVEEIADAANIAPRTFFNYFASKESAVIGADPERADRIAARLLARPSSETPIEALRAVYLEYTTAIAEDLDEVAEGRESWFKRYCVVRQDADLRSAHVAHMYLIEQKIAHALAERLGAEPDDPYPMLVAATVIAAARVAAVQWSAKGGGDSLARLTAAAIDAVAGGLSNPTPFAPSITPAIQPSPSVRPRPEESSHE